MIGITAVHPDDLKPSLQLLTEILATGLNPPVGGQLNRVIPVGMGVNPNISDSRPGGGKSQSTHATTPRRVGKKEVTTIQ
jgi:hypothetical protein